MIMVNVAEAKARLSEYLKRVEGGEVVVVARHNRPVAELRAVAAEVHERRPYGLCQGEFTVPDDFDAPLPEDVLRPFEGL